MKTSSHFRISLVFTALIIAFFATTVVALRSIDRTRTNTRPEEVLYIPSAKVLQRMSLGYTGLLADIYWTRAVQYFGGKHQQRAVDYKLLYPLLDITTQLDPHLTVAYRFGVNFLSPPPPNGAGQPEKAVELVQFGIKNNPDNWQLYYDLGFVQALELKDYLAAARSFEQGSKAPNAHPFLKVLAANMAQHGGDPATARLLWRLTYDTTEDKMVKANAIRHLMALDVDEIVPKLESVVREYKAGTGKQPSSFAELVTAGYLPGIPKDPIGEPYRLMSDGRVEVQDPDALPFITQGLPFGYKPKILDPFKR